MDRHDAFRAGFDPQEVLFLPFVGLEQLRFLGFLWLFVLKRMDRLPATRCIINHHAIIWSHNPIPLAHFELNSFHAGFPGLVRIFCC